MLTKKQELFFKLIVNCYYEEKKYPNLKTLKQKSNYKSYNTIYKYINQLEKKGYIKINSQKEIIYIKESLFNDPFLNIPIINEKQTIMLSNSFFKKATDEACYYQLQALPLIHALFEETNPIPVKEAINLLEFDFGKPRLPLVKCSTTLKERIRKLLLEQ